MAKAEPRVIVVGGGLAGLSAAVRVAESGTKVDLFSLVPVKRSHSVCAQGGINACNDVARQQGYSEWQHMDETLIGGDFLNHQPPVYEMTHWAPKIIDLLDRMGVPFNRTSEGMRDLRLFGGSLFKRTHFAGASTGQQLLYGLDEQTRRYEAEGKINKYEFWEFLWPIIDDEGVCKGIVAQDVRSMEIKAFRGDAVVMASGGNGLMFGKSTMSVICTGAAVARCYQAGAYLGNPEMIQVHPTAIPGEDKCRLMSESARGEGGRVWVPRKKGDDRHPLDITEEERYYFLEEKYPGYGNLVPRDIATREIFWVCQEGLGIGGANQVYLDITHLPIATKNKLAAILEIYEKFTGDDPREVPMKIFPAVHYTMGGLYTIYEPYDPERDTYTPASEPKRQPNEGLLYGDPKNMMTNIPGLYAFGESNYAYHGATRLGANALLSCIFDGLYNGLSVHNYAHAPQGTPAGELPDALFDKYVEQEKAKVQKLTESTGANNPYEIHQELGLEMTATCTVVKEEQRLLQGREKLAEIKAKYQDLKISDTGVYTNQNVSFARALGDMIVYSDALMEGSIARKESRGSHYRSDYTERVDDQFHKTTKVKYDADADKPIIEWEDIPSPLVPLRARTYGKVDASPEKKEEAAAS
ncbi:FAD-binding protein [Algisphaera agarilytica]|uniref:succinate dehydrogenase n=1 Tax=Algisphaera agarilytica TaxID=1385975 RepID=A0A7X0LLX9_9BACT|nr:FAD-binding protein [Algisphaera agarilytica]MBB6431086.1 succinate dehydrogenase / fumarate reductase flavoprotein subunit [Algisphaera agarilytica]